MIPSADERCHAFFVRVMVPCVRDADVDDDDGDDDDDSACFYVDGFTRKRTTPTQTRNKNHYEYSQL